MKMIRGLSIALLAGLLVTSAASAGVIQLSWAHVSGNDWALNADILAEDAVVGWGLDLYTPAVVASYGPLWSEIGAASPDPDDATVALNFAAIGTFPPGAVFGTNVLLATLTLGTGVTPTFAMIGAHANDLNEGFARDPALAGSPFVPFTPEPATLALLGLGALALLRRR